MNIDGAGVVFSGMSSVGKSTLSIYAATSGRAKFITDNYLLYDSDKLYPFPEWIRLSDQTSSLLKANTEDIDGGISKVFFRRYNRNYHTLEKKVISDIVNCKYFLQVYLGNKFSAKKISKEEMLEIVILNDTHVKEFPEHSLSGLTVFILGDKIGNNKKTEVLEKILSRSLSYEIVISKNDTLEESFNNINRLIMRG